MHAITIVKQVDDLGEFATPLDEDPRDVSE